MQSSRGQLDVRVSVLGVSDSLITCNVHDLVCIIAQSSGSYQSAALLTYGHEFMQHVRAVDVLGLLSLMSCYAL